MKLIKTMTAHENVRSYFLEVGVDWQFNIEKAPWWGGIFERMIHSTKRCLRKTLGQAKLTYDEVLTALTEVEAITGHLKKTGPCFISLYLWQFITVIHSWFAVNFH